MSEDSAVKGTYSGSQVACVVWLRGQSMYYLSKASSREWEEWAAMFTSFCGSSLNIFVSVEVPVSLPPVVKSSLSIGQVSSSPVTICVNQCAAETFRALFKAETSVLSCRGWLFISRLVAAHHAAGSAAAISGLKCGSTIFIGSALDFGASRFS